MLEEKDDCGELVIRHELGTHHRMVMNICFRCVGRSPPASAPPKLNGSFSIDINRNQFGVPHSCIKKSDQRKLVLLETNTSVV